MEHQDASAPVAPSVPEGGRGTLAMLRKAVAQRRAVLAFQPIVQASRPEAPVFHEGALQFHDACGYGLAGLPSREAWETTELGRSIDCLTLEMGLLALAEDDSLRLAIDMSPHSIEARRWRQILERGLAADPTIAERLILQISESSATREPESVAAFTKALQAQGVVFALSEFGAGFTSFRYLRQFHFDVVKIDSQYCAGIADDPDSPVLTRALLAIARQFEMFAIATGVATQRDAALLGKLGVDCLQGPLFGQPSTRAPWQSTAEQKRA